MPKYKIRSIKFNFVMNLLLTGSSLVFPLITFPIISRTLLADTYGLCTWATSIANWFSILGMLGVSRYGVRAVAQHRDNAQSLKETVQGILFVTIISTLVSTILFTLLILFTDGLNQDKTLLLINGAAIIFNTLGVTWFFQGIEQYTYITIRGILIKLSCLIGIVLFVKTPDDYLIYAALLVGANGIASIVNLVYMLTILSPQIRSTKKIRKRIIAIAKSARPHLKPLVVFFVISAAISAYTILDTTMLGMLSTTREVGYYTAAINIKSALVGIVTAFSGVLLPRASYMIANEQVHSYSGLIRKSIAVVLSVSIPLALLMAHFSSPLIIFYAGSDFAASAPTISIVVLSIIPIGLSSIFCDAILVPNNKEGVCTTIYIVAAVSDLILNFLLIPTYGAIGAALATLLVEIMIAFLMGLSSYHFIKKRRR